MTDRITILYGSETGNAEEYAKYLKQRLRSYNLKAKLSTLDGFPLKQLITDTDYLIIICSTTGQGELPRNAKSFMKFILKKKLPHDLFQHLHFTTFGLGDSSYVKYNYAIKKIHARMTQLGCQELSPRCEADEMSPEGVDGFYLEWETQLIAALSQKISVVKQIDDQVVPIPEFKVIMGKSKEDEAKAFVEANTKALSDNSILPKIYNNLRHGTVFANERITAKDHFQDVRHIKIKSKDLDYKVGDTISLYPCNFDEDVQALLELQPQWLAIADKQLRVKNLIDQEIHITLRSLIKYHLDIMSIPRRSFFSMLWRFCDNSTEDGQREQDKLREFGAFDDPEELYNYANRPRRLILETITEFSNLNIPVSYILDLIPLIKPRMFSIASRPNADEVELVVAIVEYKTILRRTRKGLCTRWLKSLEPGDEIVFSFDKSPFVIDKDNPIIMVAPGTGVAPMKSLIDNLLYQNSTREMFLFFGCRFEERDHLIKNFWEKVPNLHIMNCFSRDTESKYKYVQDALIDQASLVGDLVCNQNAKIFVCGSSGKMPREVKLTFVEIIKRFLKVDDTQAQLFVNALEDTGRYKEDAW